jgi:hypothetical protein
MPGRRRPQTLPGQRHGIRDKGPRAPRARFKVELCGR